MKGYVVREYTNGREWWWFFTQPFCFSVYWKPDGSKTMEQYRDEQVAVVRDWKKSGGSMAPAWRRGNG